MLRTDALSFDLDRFIADCRGALQDDPPQRAVREVAARAVAEPAAVLEKLGRPNRAGIHRLYHSDRLTILNVIWAPRMMIMPHEHRMWAIIGVYSGREDNIFWRRVQDGQDGRIEAAGAQALVEGDAVALGRDIIHSVTNPVTRFSGAIHVYGGDFFTQERSEWDPATLLEQPFSVDRTMRMFEEANARCVAD